MAVPFRRTSSAKKRRRRNSHFLVSKQVNNCKNCGATALPHHACKECGFYKKKVIFKHKKNI